MKILIGVIGAVVVVVVLVLAAAAMLGPKASGGDGKGMEVVVEPVGRGELLETIAAPGIVDPRSKVEISARVSARITELPFDEGDKVKAGDVILRLDASELEASLRSRQSRRDAQSSQIAVDEHRIESETASLKRLRASLADAERDLARQKQLLASGDVSSSAVDDAQTRYDELVADLESRTASLAASRRALEVARHHLAAADGEITQAKENLAYTVISSPIDGVVIRRNADVGELAITGTMNNPGTVILEVADLTQMLMVAEVDESDIAQVREGQGASVRLVAFDDREFEGVVESVALASIFSRSGSTIFPTKIRIADEGERIPAGLNADAEIVVKRHEDALLVRSECVSGVKLDDLPDDIVNDNPHIDNEKTIATVVYRFVDGKAVVTPVIIGPSDGDHTLIESGLTEEDRVIAGPYKALEKLEHDMTVREKKQEADDGAKPSDEAEPDKEESKDQDE